MITREVLAALPDDELLALKADLHDAQTWRPQPHQRAPEGTDWYLWLLLAGRGTGKTDACAYYVDEYMKANPGHRGAIIAPTLGDAVSACVTGPSGLLAHNPTVRMRTRGGGTDVYWPNGSECHLFGASGPDDVERLRAGGNRHVAWLEEFAAWRRMQECWDHMRFGLRLGDHPHAIASTTPKPRPLLLKLIENPTTRVTSAETDDNKFLDASVRQALYDAYGGTRLGRQELKGEVLRDVPGAIWNLAQIEADRVDIDPPLARVVIAVDPAVTANEDSDFTGISGGGLGVDGQFYVQRSNHYRLSPAGWAKKAIDLYEELEADRIVAEVNNGGDMVAATIRSIRKDVPITVIHASRGKTLRAEPVSALYEQHRVHHVGTFLELEDEMCSFPVANEHDDLVDSLVYLITDLAAKSPNPIAAFVGTTKGKDWI